MIKARPWSGKDLKGEWLVTIKIDGVRAIWNPVMRRWESRRGKPLYNIPTRNVDIASDVEVFCGSFKETIERTRTSTKDMLIIQDQLYSLDPLDKRLRCLTLRNPSAAEIIEMMNDAISTGYEGLVLRQGDTWLKVKPTETYDVPVTGIIEGTGKHAGRMGALETPMGKVGTGFTDAEREEWWSRDAMFCPGSGDEWPTIEVECMHLTDDGKFRHPRFIRVRPDK